MAARAQKKEDRQGNAAENSDSRGKTDDKFDLEDGFEKIDAIIKQLDDPKISLDDTFELYKKGMGILKECNASIDRVEKQVQVLEEGE